MTRAWVHDRHPGTRRVRRDPPPWDHRAPQAAPPAGGPTDREPEQPGDPSGIDLADIVSAAAPLPPDRAVTLIERAAAALDAHHATGAVHGRICPGAFVLLPGPPESALLRPSSGAPPRPAPEQITDGPAGRHTDVYALACVLFELLTGRPPYVNTTAMIALTRAGLPLPPVGAYQAWVPVALDGVIARATAPEPAHRYPDAGALAAAARAAVAEALDPAAALTLPVWSRADAADPPTVPLDAVTVPDWGPDPGEDAPRLGAADLPGWGDTEAATSAPVPVPGWDEATGGATSRAPARTAAVRAAAHTAAVRAAAAATRRVRSPRSAEPARPRARHPVVRHESLRRAVAWAAAAVVVASAAGLLAVLPSSHSTVLTGHDGPVRVLATGRLDGRAIVVSGGQDATVRVWDVATGEPVGAPMTGHTDAVHGLATAQLLGRAVAVSAADDGTVRVWDLATGGPVGAPMSVRTAGPLSVVTFAGRPVMVAADGAGGVEVRDLATGARVAAHPADPQDRVRSVAATELGGRAVAVAADALGTARVRDLATGAPVGPAFPADTVSVAQLGERPVVVAGRPGATAVRDLASGAPLDGQIGLAGSGAAVVTDIGGRPAVVDADGSALRVRDLTGAPVRPPLDGHDGEIDAVATVDVAEIRVADGVPRAGAAAAGNPEPGEPLGPVVLSGGSDGTVRVWELDPAD
ncbi:hypothetical protein [Pseudonocardia sp.]|uniref:WD40 repeat domain-containing protein n=1 Tax=Pseudonocardia sp. TaxID=60912 RepID=UPI003D11643F